jgi:hypothetical protein
VNSYFGSMLSSVVFALAGEWHPGWQGHVLWPTSGDADRSGQAAPATVRDVKGEAFG